MRVLSLLLVVALSACGGVEPGEWCAETGGLGSVFGACAVQAPGGLPVVRTGILAETARAIEVGAGYWGVDTDVLDGWTLQLDGGWFACGDVWTYGCARLDLKVIRAAAGDDGCRTCVLVHEIGHVVLNGDGDHVDPRWAGTGIDVRDLR